MERWRPVYSVEDILNAVLVMLNEPNPNSPENVDAGVIVHMKCLITILDNVQGECKTIRKVGTEICK